MRVSRFFSPVRSKGNSNPVAARGGNPRNPHVLPGPPHGHHPPWPRSGGPRGGLERRGAIFDRVPRSRRLVINTGSIVDAETEQNLIKFPVFLQA